MSKADRVGVAIVSAAITVLLLAPLLAWVGLLNTAQAVELCVAGVLLSLSLIGGPR